MPAPAPARVRRHPLSPEQLGMALRLLDSASEVLESVAAGRRVTGTDAVPIRALCHKLGKILAAIGREAES